jgi:hypothetical protein
MSKSLVREEAQRIKGYLDQISKGILTDRRQPNGITGTHDLIRYAEAGLAAGRDAGRLYVVQSVSNHISLYLEDPQVTRVPTEALLAGLVATSTAEPRIARGLYEAWHEGVVQAQGEVLILIRD